ncbi:MFS transporter [Labrys monachus]|uniref:MFS family arabinose efflux permease n=1 Tax=Labrys monachus TaxID=217067 RepID=A0ABU0FEY3_9HYPH|nr:MFS transporter [Labrys monachus]MDQ0393174.1 putative MFS family arabinose efflux permease [Labrys monachus]
MSDIASTDHALAAPATPAWITLLLATACGLIVANLYYAQPLIGLISADLGMTPGAAGLIVTMTQIGYGTGLLLLVPLGDLVENRKLVLCVMSVATIALVGLLLARNSVQFLACALCIGLGSVAVQILVPYAAHLAPEATRGRVVGNVMSGLMVGIMLARPVSSLITYVSSWHVVFALSIAVMIALGIVLARALPARQPAPGPSYGGLLRSMVHLVRTTPVLRRRALYQACMFGAFSLYWTTSPLWLASPTFGLSQSGIAWVALAGVAGAISAPLAGRIADRGWSRPASGIAMALAAIAFLLTHIATPGSTLSLALLIAAAVVLDFGVTANLVLGQRMIYVLGAEYRSRLNGLYMATFFVGGAMGSAVGAWAFAHGGWTMASWIGFALPVMALLYFTTERRPA